MNVDFSVDIDVGVIVPVVYTWVAWSENAVSDIRSTNENAITWYKAEGRNHDDT